MEIEKLNCFASPEHVPVDKPTFLLRQFKEILMALKEEVWG